MTFDYRCPFARNVHEHLIAALRGGAPFSVTFHPFSLDQAHAPDGDTSLWLNPSSGEGLLSLAAGIVVRDRFPDQFLDVHHALFSARHDSGRDLRDRNVVAQVLQDAGVSADQVLPEIDDGWPFIEIRRAHEEAARDLAVFGVPTFIVGDKAVFVRLMNRPSDIEHDSDKESRGIIEDILNLITTRPDLNEFKHTTISR